MSLLQINVQALDAYPSFGREGIGVGGVADLPYPAVPHRAVRP